MWIFSLVILTSVEGGSFIIKNDAFVRDGKNVQIKAGEIHYSRVPVEYWEDRLMRLRAMGLNAIQTYVPWNWHVAEQNKPDFSSPDRNISHFISLAGKHGLMVVVRVRRVQK
jgi:beta-galactosidase GanA